MSISEIASELPLYLISIVAVMYWSEHRSRELFRVRVEHLVSMLNERAEEQEAERRVQTEKLNSLAQLVQAEHHHQNEHLIRIESTLESSQCDRKSVEVALNDYRA